MFSIVCFRIFFMQTLFVIIWGSMASEIGNYSQYIENYNLCGLSRNTLREESSDCFEYHKVFPSNLRNARPAQKWESPWMVSIEERKDTFDWVVRTKWRGSCGGVLISDKWVLTSAHCLNYDEYRIFIHQTYMGGTFIGSQTYYKHPHYNDFGNDNDIGLIKLKKSFNYKTGRNYQASSICLPTKDFHLKKRIGLISGWTKGEGLHVGPKFITESRNVYPRVLTYESIFGQVQTCSGDSGSPVWIYHMGRAVLMGIHSGIFMHRNYDRETKCGENGKAAYVPLYIDWILETINNK